MNATIVAAMLLLAGPKIEIAVGVGADSNPFELPYDQFAANAEQKPMTGAFVPVEASADWRTPYGNMFRAGAKASFGGTFFGYVGQDEAATEKTNASDASRWTGEVSAPFVFDPKREGRNRWRADLTLEPFVGMHRETFTSHRSGTPFPAPTSDPYPDLGERYNANDFGGKVEGDLSLGKIIDVRAAGRYTRVDYVEDYTAANDETDSWDYGETRADVDVYVRPEGFLAAAGYTLRVREYDERFPRDDDGNEVVSVDPRYVPQVFIFHDVNVKGGVMRDRGRAILRFRNSRRVDAYEGYQSYSENAVGGDFRLKLATDSELRFGAGYSVRSYEELRVGYDPAEPVSNRRRLDLDTGFEWPAFSKWTRLYVAAGLTSQASANPLYTWVGFRGMTGVRVALR